MSEEKTVDLDQWNRQRENVTDLAKQVSNDLADGKALAVQTTKLQEMTAKVIDALLNDMAYLHQMVQVTQTQMGTVAQQSYLALETLKLKEVVTSKEIHDLHNEIVQKAIKQEEEDRAALEAAQKAEEPAGGELLQFPGSRDEDDPSPLVG